MVLKVGVGGEEMCNFTLHVINLKDSLLSLERFRKD